MIRINVGGMAAKEVSSLVAQIGGDQVEVRVVSDIQGTREVAQGRADYYLGACATGGGGALGMAIANLGYARCFTASTAGRPPREEEIQKAVAGGKKAFGFSSDHVRLVVPMIMKAVLAKHSQSK